MTLAVTPYNLYGEHIKTKVAIREKIKHTTGSFQGAATCPSGPGWTHPDRSHQTHPDRSHPDTPRQVTPRHTQTGHTQTGHTQTHPDRSLPSPVARFTVKQLSVPSLPGQRGPRPILQITYNSLVSNGNRSDPPFFCVDGRVYYDSLQSER